MILLIKKLSYQNSDKWIEMFSKTLQHISNDKWIKHKFELDNSVAKMPKQENLIY